MTIDLTPVPEMAPPAAFVFFQPNEKGVDQSVEERVAKLELLMPAWRSGLRTYLWHRRLGGRLVELANAASDGIAVYRADGKPLHTNVAWSRIFAAGPERDRATHEIEYAVRAIAALSTPGPRKSVAIALDASSTRLARTPAGLYRVVITRLVDQAELGLGESLFLALVVRVGASPLQSEMLVERFQLTPRELEVARLMREGCSNREIARRLGVTLHTARRHNERILEKLRVHSRAQAVAVLSDMARQA